MAITEGVKPLDRTMLDRPDPVNRHKTAGMNPMGTLWIGALGRSPATPRLVGRSLTLNPLQAPVKNEPSGIFHRSAKNRLPVLGAGAYNPVHRRRGAEQSAALAAETDKENSSLAV